MHREIKKNYLFLGFAVPDEEMEKVFIDDNFPQVQTHKFNWNLIKGLEYYNEFDFTYISSKPVSEYPVFSQKKIAKRDWNINIEGKKISIQEIPYLNMGFLKLITRFFYTLFYSLKKYHFKTNKAGVIVYSVHVPYMIVGLIIAKIYKLDYIAIWTDPPAVTAKDDSYIKKKYRNVEFKLSKILMRKATKVIALTKHLAEDFAPGKPYMVMEGLVDLEDINKSPQSSKKIYKNNPLKVVYTGSLSKRYGIKNIVDGILSLDCDDIILEVYGKGDFEEELINIAETTSRVIYKGFIKNSEILKVQRKADFLINARSIEDEFVKYSFPSKTLEYMLSGTPLITTMLPGIPEEYKKYVIVLDNNNPEVIANKFEEILRCNSSDFSQLGLDALKFASTKNIYNQAKRIIKFLKEDWQGDV